MIILHGCMRIAAGKRDETLIALEPLVEKSLAEPGCLGYTVAFDILDDHLLRVFEAFESDSALDAHRASGHVGEWKEAAELLGISDIELRRYESRAKES